MAFELPDLPYAHDALAANGMSKETLEYHHDLHHNAYVTNGNAAIAGTEWDGKSLEAIITGTYAAGSVAQNGIFNNISQLWNHNQFWQMMSPGASKMPGDLEKALTDSFGSVDEFKKAVLGRRCRAVRVGLVLAGQERRWRAGGDQNRKRRQPAVLWPDGAAGLRCVGAFLLHRLPQQAAGISGKLPRQSGELGKRRVQDVTSPETKT